MNNIKDILNENDSTMETPTLPAGHRAEFLDKLSASEAIVTKRQQLFSWKSMAAAFVFLFGIGAFIYTNFDNEETAQSSLFIEMESIEDEYLANIAKEWEAFRLSANDTYLIKKYEERLENLDASYQELKQEFLVQKNSLTTLEKMIKNLQMRLDLLREIQQHLKRLEDEQNNI